MLVVESRSITVDQLRHKYGEADVCQRLGFANMIRKGAKPVSQDFAPLRTTKRLPVYRAMRLMAKPPPGASFTLSVWPAFTVFLVMV